MKDYELSVLYHPDLEMNLDPVLDKVAKLIEANGGKIVKVEAEGKKRMSYKIKGQEFAIYYYYDLQLPPEAPQKITSVMNITDEILRPQLVKADERKAKYIAYLKEKAAKEPAEGEETKEEVTEEK
ncbi:30S ribosomal protein S6 [Candidatus Saccharibacteria bacterium]|nr:30S ribosomal protein S6 [Candidatus Saccharibacteria bacterium]